MNSIFKSKEIYNLKLYMECKQRIILTKEVSRLKNSVFYSNLEDLYTL